MTDKHLHSETNQEKEGMPEEYVQPPMAEQGQENPVQPPIVEQDQQKSVPTSGILTLTFYLALGYLGFVLCGAIAVGPWVILYLLNILPHMVCFILATVLLRNGKKKGDKTTLYAATICYFISVIAANDPYWHFNQFISLLMAGMVLIGTIMLPNEQ